jgi:predicted aldo/keto reductase-like oxidoreductase
VQLQFNYVDYEDPKVQSRACYEVCRKHGKPVIVMEPVKGGSLVDIPQEGRSYFTSGSPASYAVRFAAGFEGIFMVLSGMSDLAQLEENTAYMMDFHPLSPEELEAVAKVRTLYQAQHRIPCTACRYCVDGCPAGIDIPAVFACMNDHRKGEGAPKEAYAAMENKASACIGCGQCEAACPQGLQIRKLLEAVAKEFE